MQQHPSSDIYIRSITLTTYTPQCCFSTILMKTVCNFVSVWDISTIIRSFHSTLHAECKERLIHCRNKPSSSQNAMLWRKLGVISFPFGIFRRLNVAFSPFYTPNVVHSSFSIETSPAARRTQPSVDYDENLLLFRFYLLHAMLHAEISTHSFHRHMKHSTLQNAISW